MDTGLTMNSLKFSGLITQKEMSRVHDAVLDHLTAENVFTRIRTHYEFCE